ncbi:MAG: ABC transporter permease [Spirochaetaceae bacterium]|jgi:ABC-2 type transport system permease protein|nr:ABC transporter permease [Spirochaetaceae bacterium]
MIGKIAKTSMKEQLRSPVILLLSLLTAPLFVLIYVLFFPSETSSFDVAYYSQERNQALLEYMNNWSMEDQTVNLNMHWVNSPQEGSKDIEQGEAQVLVIIPEGFEDSLDQVKSGLREQSERVIFSGDLSSSMYSIAFIMTYSSIDQYISQRTGHISPFAMEEQPLGNSMELREIDYYIPGLMIFALIILLFQVSMNLSGLVESGILKRLRLTRATTLEILSGYSIPVVLIGLCSFFLTLLVAKLFGSNLHGNWLLTALVALLTTLAITATGMIVSAFASSTSSAFIMANFPLMLFMFFSGAMYPIKKITMFNLGNISIGVFDLLPTTHGVNALHKLLVLQSDFSGILYELICLTLLTVLFLAFGVRLYYKRQMEIG